MNFLSCLFLAFLLIGSMVFSKTHGTTKRSRPMANRKSRQGPSESGTDAEPSSLVKKKSTSIGKTLDKSFAVHVLGRRKRQAFHDMSRGPSFMFYHHPSDHGTFNQQTYSCDEVMSRPCERPSDCHGCLGLFTCKMPQGRCDFKSVSKRTDTFHQSLQQDETSDGNEY